MHGGLLENITSFIKKIFNYNIILYRLLLELRLTRKKSRVKSIAKLKHSLKKNEFMFCEKNVGTQVIAC